MNDIAKPVPPAVAAPPTLALGRLDVRPRTGEESLHDSGRPLGATLQDFWRWSTSDLVSNATRDVLAEFLVAGALGIDLDGVRDEWAPFDLTTPDGIKVEVKSAAYLQSWAQTRLSDIVFSTRPSRAWSADTGLYADSLVRQADVYVFPLLAHKDKATVDPLNVDQWRFFVVPTPKLNARTRSQTSITLPSLRALVSELRFGDVRAAVADALVGRGN